MPRLRFAAAALLVACSSSTSELQISQFAAGGLSLTTEKTAYSVADVGPGTVGVRATLTSGADRPYYSRLGDAFNGAVDQNPLYAADGSDGIVERRSGDGWAKVSSGTLVEGIREVVLSPGKTYTLLVNLSPPIQTGAYRLTVYVREMSGGDRTLAIRSATFDIR